MKTVTTLAMLGALALSPLIAADGSIPADERDMAQRAADMFKAQRYDEAAGLYQVILRAHPNCLYALGNLGVTRFMQARYSEARRAFSKAVAIDAKDPGSLLGLGIVEYDLKDFSSAAEHLHAAMAMKPGNAAAHDYLGRTYEALGRHAEACEEAVRAQQIERKESLPFEQDDMPEDKSRISS